MYGKPQVNRMHVQTLSQACRAKQQACSAATGDGTAVNRAWGPIRISPDGRRVSECKQLMTICAAVPWELSHACSRISAACQLDWR